MGLSLDIKIGGSLGVRRQSDIAGDSTLAINHWQLTIIGQVKTVLLLSNSG
jgi:hypothetical protein